MAKQAFVASISKPNLFIIGAPKCGTTTLFDYLGRYPEVGTGNLKEPHFFCDDLAAIQAIKSTEEYLKNFPTKFAGRYLLDASTNYIYSSVAIRNILDFNPLAKIIVMVRHPADLVRSLHQHLMYRQIETEPDLSLAWDLGKIEERAPKFIKSHPYPGHLSYKLAGKLGHCLEPILRQLNQDQCGVFFFEDLKEQPDEFFLQLAEFLELPVDSSIKPNLKNPARTYRFAWMNRWFFYPSPGLKKIKNVLKRIPLAKSLNYQSILSRGKAKTDAMPVDLREKIIDFFRNDIQLLAELSGRDLNHWLKPCSSEYLDKSANIGRNQKNRD